MENPSVSQILDLYRQANGLKPNALVNPKAAMDWHAGRDTTVARNYGRRSALPARETQQAVKDLQLPGTQLSHWLESQNAPEMKGLEFATQVGGGLSDSTQPRVMYTFNPEKKGWESSRGTVSAENRTGGVPDWVSRQVTRELQGGNETFPVVRESHLYNAPGAIEGWKIQSVQGGTQSGNLEKLAQLRRAYATEPDPAQRAIIQDKGTELREQTDALLNANVDRLRLGEKYTGLSPRYAFSPAQIESGATKGTNYYAMGGPQISKALGMNATELINLPKPDLNLLLNASSAPYRDQAFTPQAKEYLASGLDPMLDPENKNAVAQLSLNRRAPRPLALHDMYIPKQQQGINYGDYISDPIESLKGIYTPKKGLDYNGSYAEPLSDFYGDVIRSSTDANLMSGFGQGTKGIRDIPVDRKTFGAIASGQDPLYVINQSESKRIIDPYKGSMWSFPQLKGGDTPREDRHFRETMSQLFPESSRVDDSQAHRFAQMDVNRPELEGNIFTMQGQILDHPDRYATSTNYTDLYEQPRGRFSDGSPRIIGAFTPEFRPKSLTAALPGESWEVPTISVDSQKKYMKPLGGFTRSSEDDFSGVPKIVNGEVQKTIIGNVPARYANPPQPGESVSGIEVANKTGGFSPAPGLESTRLQQTLDPFKDQLQGLRNQYVGASPEERLGLIDQAKQTKGMMLSTLDPVTLQRYTPIQSGYRDVPDDMPLIRVGESTRLGPSDLSTPETIKFNSAAPNIPLETPKEDYTLGWLAKEREQKQRYEGARDLANEGLDLIKQQYDFSAPPVRDAGDLIIKPHGNTLEGPALVGDSNLVDIGHQAYSDALDQMIGANNEVAGIRGLDQRDRSGLVPIHSGNEERLGDYVARQNINQQRSALGRDFTPTEDLMNSPAAQALREKAASRQLAFDLAPQDSGSAYGGASNKMFEVEQRVADEQRAQKQARIQSQAAQEAARLHAAGQTPAQLALKDRAKALLERMGKTHLMVG